MGHTQYIDEKYIILLAICQLYGSHTHIFIEFSLNRLKNDTIRTSGEQKKQQHQQ